MEACDCVLRLRGLIGNEVQKTNVTAAEVWLLRRLHGEQSIPLEKVSNRRTMKGWSQWEERKRLVGIYGPAKVAAHLGPQGTKLITSLAMAFEPFETNEDIDGGDEIADKWQKVIGDAGDSDIGAAQTDGKSGSPAGK